MEYILLNYLPLNYSGEQAAEVREQWKQLLDKWKQENKYVNSFVFPAEGYLLSETQQAKGSIKAGSLKLVNAVVLKVENYDVAIAEAKFCPILKQGATVEIKQVQPRPQSN